MTMSQGRSARAVSPLAAVAWPDVPDTVTLLVPVGSTEQHGPHLPFDTDTLIAQAVSQRVADRRNGLLVAPPIAIAASGEHQDFRGTLSIGIDVLGSVLVEIARSASTWARRVLFVNGHGGNMVALDRAVRQVRDEDQEVGWVACAAEGFDLHAGFSETSLVLHLRPESVVTDRAAVGAIQPLSEILWLLRAKGVAAVSANGVLGDPTGASAAAGAETLETMVADICSRLDRWQPDSRGRLQKTERTVRVGG